MTHLLEEPWILNSVHRPELSRVGKRLSAECQSKASIRFDTRFHRVCQRLRSTLTTGMVPLETTAV